MTRYTSRALSLIGLLACVGCVHAPMPWSPDGKWIAYTVEVRRVGSILTSGWMFRSITTPLADAFGSGPPTSYRLWATRKDTEASVLLEESSQPLTSPGWSPDGRALAFGRVVALPDGRGRFEVVIVDGPDRRRIVSSRPLAEITAEASRLPGQAVVWSPDGRYLAVPQLSPLGLSIIRADNGRQINVIHEAFLPSWSPDGARLAFYLRGAFDTLNCLDSPLNQPRMLMEVGHASQAPVWTRDGLTVVVAARKPFPRGGDLVGEQIELVRLRVDTGRVETLQSFSTEVVVGRGRSVEGTSITFDGESLFTSTVADGSPNVIVWSHPRENEIYKRFAILDPATPMGSLSVAPDGSCLAARVAVGNPLGPPALCDLESQDPRTRLIAPDDASRLEWIATLVGTARSILATLPIVSADPKSPSPARLMRPTLLPVLGEIDPNSEQAGRLRKLAKLGRPLCDRLVSAPAPEPGITLLLDEARLFFDYCLGSYHDALQSIDRLETDSDPADKRLGLLSVRAQILIAQGKIDRAEEVIEFLRSRAPKNSRRLEWTGDSYLLATDAGANQAGQTWPDYLQWRASKVRESLVEDGNEVHFNPDAPRLNLRIDAPLLNGDLPFPDRGFLNEPELPQRRRLLPR